MKIEKEINFKYTGKSYEKNSLKLIDSVKTLSSVNTFLNSSKKALKKTKKIPKDLKEIEIYYKAETGSFNFKIIIETDKEIDIKHFKLLLKNLIKYLKNKTILYDPNYREEIEILKKNFKFLNSLDLLVSNIIDLEDGKLLISNKIENKEDKDENSFEIKSDEKIDIQKGIFNLLKKKENWKDIELYGIISKVESSLKKTKESEKRIRRYFFEINGTKKKYFANLSLNMIS